MKDVKKMTLGEIEIHRKESEEIEKAIGFKPSILEGMQESQGQFTDLIGKHVIVRTYSAGVFAGTLKARNGKEAELTEARRLWSWSGAASLSQMANDGVKNPSGCKFAQPVTVQLTEAIEILPTTKAAQKNIEAVPVWQN